MDLIQGTIRAPLHGEALAASCSKALRESSVQPPPWQKILECGVSYCFSLWMIGGIGNDGLLVFDF